MLELMLGVLEGYLSGLMFRVLGLLVTDLVFRGDTPIISPLTLCCFNCHSG